MKAFTTILISTLWFTSVWAADEGDSHDDEDIPLRSEFNVTNADTCDTWCGDVEGEYVYMQKHGDFEDMEIDYLEGWECHCEDETAAEEKHCIIPHELKSCESLGLCCYLSPWFLVWSHS